MKGAFYDVTGITGIYRAVNQKDIVTGVEYQMTDAQRGSSFTSGSFQFVMVLIGVYKGTQKLVNGPKTTINLPRLDASPLSAIAGASGNGGAGKYWNCVATRCCSNPCVTN